MHEELYAGGAGAVPPAAPVRTGAGHAHDTRPVRSRDEAEERIRRKLGACRLAARGLWLTVRQTIEADSCRPGDLLLRDGRPVTDDQLAVLAGCAPHEHLAELVGAGLLERRGGSWHAPDLAAIHDLLRRGRERTRKWRTAAPGAKRAASRAGVSRDAHVARHVTEVAATGGESGGCAAGGLFGGAGGAGLRAPTNTPPSLPNSDSRSSSPPPEAPLRSASAPAEPAADPAAMAKKRTGKHPSSTTKEEHDAVEEFRSWLRGCWADAVGEPFDWESREQLNHRGAWRSLRACGGNLDQLKTAFAYLAHEWKAVAGRADVTPPLAQLARKLGCRDRGPDDAAAAREYLARAHRHHSRQSLRYRAERNDDATTTTDTDPYDLIPGRRRIAGTDPGAASAG